MGMRGTRRNSKNEQSEKIGDKNGRALLGWAGETSFDFAQDKSCPYVCAAAPACVVTGT
jgi:hypothetical protein